MTYRPFGATGLSVSAIGFGGWAIGSCWGRVDDPTSFAALERALALGVSFFDTADVYGRGRSERLLGKLRRAHPRATTLIATKAGRRLPVQRPEGYTRAALRGWLQESSRNLGVATLDLLQLHCPPTEVLREQRVFTLLDELAEEGLLRHYGVSVETVEQAKLALEHPRLASIQIVFNLFRQKPADEILRLARARKVAIIARVPLASGLLTGRMTAGRRFPMNDHRHFNLRGEKFDVGETFAGVPFDRGLRAAVALRELVPTGWTLAQFALRWILMHEGVTTAIPGCKTPAQAEENARAADLPPIGEGAMAKAREVYERQLRGVVQGRW